MKLSDIGPIQIIGIFFVFVLVVGLIVIGTTFGIGGSHSDPQKNTG